MSEPRKTADTITDDGLDRLYAIVEQADEAIAANKRLSECRTRAVRQRAEQAEAERDGAYRERAHLVALLAAMTDGAVITPALDLDEPGWWITYLNIAGQQASWHISPRDAGLFRDVERVEPDDPRAQWDGHTTDEKYAAIAAWTTEMAQARGPIASPLRAQCEATVRMILAGTGAHTVDEWAEYVTAAILPIFGTRIDELRRERDLAIAHDRQPYPTAWAYEQAEAAIDRIRARHQRATDGRCATCLLDHWPCPEICTLDGPPCGPECKEWHGTTPATEATQTEKTTRVFAALHRSAEQDVSRVIALYEQWVKAGWPPLGTPLSRWWDARLVELHDAILPPTDHTTEQPCINESSPQKSPAPSPPGSTPTP